MKKSKVKKEIPAFKVGTLEVLTSLMSEHQWLDLLKEKHADDIGLIELIQQIGTNDEYGKHSIKQIAHRIGITTAVTTRLIHKFYEELWIINDEQPELFEQKGARYTLQFIDSYQNEYAYFTLWLPNVLTYGDSFRWSFMRGKQQAYSYYVDHIEHNFINGKQSVVITMRSGSFNLYRKTLFEKAVFFDLVTIHERFHLTQHQLDQVLKHRIENDLDGYPENLAYLRDKNKNW